MPIFEYKCAACGHQFEYLTRAGAAAECPKCQGRELEKQLSVFAVNAGGSSSSAAIPADSPCATCGIPGGPGACGMRSVQ